MGEIAHVTEMPACNFCDRLAEYDGKTNMGPWAYMCRSHWYFYGTGLGTGRGQKLVKV